MTTHNDLEVVEAKPIPTREAALETDGLPFILIVDRGDDEDGQAILSLRFSAGFDTDRAVNILRTIGRYA